MKATYKSGDYVLVSDLNSRGELYQKEGIYQHQIMKEIPDTNYCIVKTGQIESVLTEHKNLYLIKGSRK